MLSFAIKSANLWNIDKLFVIFFLKIYRYKIRY